MCIILFSYKHPPGYKLVIGTNRDEFLDRPTSPLGYFDEKKNILAGRDLRGGGTWFGVHLNGKHGAITNYRDPALNNRSCLSRGLIIKDYLEGGESPKDFIRNLSKNGSLYNGFNILVGDLNTLYFFSNVTGSTQLLTPGLYGLSNHLLDTPWPKVKRGKDMLEKALARPEPKLQPSVFSLLKDISTPPEEELPITGVGIEWERILSTIFISSPSYGTRSSTFLSITERNEVTIVEKTFSHNKQGAFDSGKNTFSFTPGS